MVFEEFEKKKSWKVSKYLPSVEERGWLSSLKSLLYCPLG